VFYLAAAFCLIPVGVGLYLMISAHRVRQESDRTLQRALAEHARERASLLTYARDLNNRVMDLAGRTWERPLEPHRELVVADPFGVDVNPEEGLHDFAEVEAAG
jgi:hypothetical protein